MGLGSNWDACNQAAGGEGEELSKQTQLMSHKPTRQVSVDESLARLEIVKSNVRRLDSLSALFDISS